MSFERVLLSLNFELLLKQTQTDRTRNDDSGYTVSPPNCLEENVSGLKETVRVGSYEQSHLDLHCFL